MTTIYRHDCSVCQSQSFSFNCDLHSCDHPYRWVCDSCGIEMSLQFSDGGRSLEQAPTGRRADRTLDLLRLRGSNQFMFIQDGIQWDDSDEESVRFFYEEHTCPSNVIKCVEVIASGEVDPHGVFELVARRIITGENAIQQEDAEEELKAMALQMQRRDESETKAKQ